nr:protein kinase 4-like [Dermatophagoides farinae]
MFGNKFHQRPLSGRNRIEFNNNSNNRNSGGNVTTIASLSRGINHQKISPFHHQYSQYHCGGSMMNNQVYTIPEEDEEQLDQQSQHDVDNRLSPFNDSSSPSSPQSQQQQQEQQQQQQQQQQRSPKTLSTLSPNQRVHQQQDRRQSISIMSGLVGGITNRFQNQRTNIINNDLQQKTSSSSLPYKGRNNRSNSEPFLILNDSMMFRKRGNSTINLSATKKINQSINIFCTSQSHSICFYECC